MSRTRILGLRDNLGKELGEVGQVLAEEAGLQNEGLPGVVRGQLASQELGLSCDSEGGSFCGVLGPRRKISSCRVLVMTPQEAAAARTLNANSSSPTVRPGRGSYRVPALATMARRVTGPLSSLEATLTPATLVGSYDPEVGEEESAAAAAKPRWESCAAWRRKTAWLPLVRADREIMVRGGCCRQLTLQESATATIERELHSAKIDRVDLNWLDSDWTGLLGWKNS